MGRILVPSPTNIMNREAYELFDDFLHYTDADLWTQAVVANGTVTLTDGRSVIKLFSTTDNDAACLATTTEQFKFVANQAMYAEMRALFADTATFNTAFCFGWCDAMAGTTITAGGDTLTITNEGAFIWVGAESGATAGVKYQFWTEMDTVAKNSVATLAPQSTLYQTLAIDIIPVSSTVFEARPFVDGKQLIDNTSGKPIMHTITLGTATDMDFGVVLRGGHADDTSLLIDYLYASQVRGA